MTASQLEKLQAEFKTELFNNILPFWFQMKTEDGFVAALDNANQPIPGKPLGLIMVARLLWTYARAYGLYQDERHRELADHAKTVLIEKFADTENGGFYWTVDETGTALETKKQCYGQAFCIYAFSEHFEATGDEDSLVRARELFYLLEDKAWEPKSSGYLETFEADWTPLEKMRLGAEDLDAPKTMNNHLHMIEGYANLLRVAPNRETRNSCRRLLRVIKDKIILPDSPRFGLFYDMNWKLIDPVISPGHDIEGSWLLCEAAEIIGDEDLKSEFKALAKKMAQLVLDTGLESGSSVYDEFQPGENGSETKCWWPQAEGVVGFFNAYELTGEERYLKASQSIWDFIKAKFIDRENGEWFWGVHSDGRLMDKEKTGPWKSAYHNGRACFEMLTRIPKRQASGSEFEHPMSET